MVTGHGRNIERWHNQVVLSREERGVLQRKGNPHKVGVVIRSYTVWHGFGGAGTEKELFSFMVGQI